jgi:hypothetical protein
MNSMRRLLDGLLRKCSGLFSISLLGCLLALHAAAPGPVQEADKPKADYQSLKALRAHIAELRAKVGNKNEAEEREGKGPKKEDESLDYLEALEAYLSVRAYPNDSVDWNALRGATAKRDTMGSIIPYIAGPTWQFLGPTNCTSPSQWAFGPGKVNGRVASAAIDPNNPSIYYVASAGGGVWKSLDSGTTWSSLGDAWSNLPTSCVVVDPSNSNVLYVGTGDWDGWGGYSQGIEKSIDGGASWTNLGNAEFGTFSVRRILIDPDNSSIVTVVTGRGAGGDGKVWRSTDAGATWTAVINTAALWCDIVCSAPDGSGNRVYYAGAGGNFEQVWSSNDRGATWTKLTTPLRTGASSYDTVDLATSPTNFGTVYLLGTGNKKIWKSINNGGAWTDITGSAVTSADWGQAWYDFYVSCSTNGTKDVLYVGLIDILQSFDGGVTWRTFMNGYTGSDLAHVDEHNTIIDPTNPNHLLTCCDGGVYSVSVGGTGIGTFSSLNKNLGVTEFYYGDFNPTDGTKMLGGAQDNGSPGAFGNLANWGCVSGGDGGAALINQTNPNIQYTTYQYFGGSSTGGTIGFNRTANGWASGAWVSTNVGTDRVAWMGPITMAANNSSVLYVPTNYLWRYTDTTNTWSPRLGNKVLSTSSTVLSIGVTKADVNTIYTGSGDGQLFVTTNAGTNWTQINTGAVPLPNRAYTAIRVRDDNAKDLLVGVSGTGSSHLWRCFDSSSPTRTWVDVSGTGPTGLPDVPINTIERDPSDPIKTWFVGTDIGVFKTIDAGSTWTNITQPLGLPNVQITQLWVRNGFLCAVTYGRGMWRLSLQGTGGTVTLAGVVVNPTAVVGPAPSVGTVMLSDVAPTGGVDVSLSSLNPGVASVPASVHVGEGSLSADFPVTTVAVATQTIVTIQANYGGSSANAQLTVNPNGLTNLTLNPVSVIGGNPSVGTITVATPAPSGGSIVQLNSSNTAVAQVPASVTIPAGQTSANFNITTSPTANDSSSTIRGTLGTGTVQAVLTVNAPTVASFTLSPTTVVGGNTSLATITLTGRSPSGGAVISLGSSDASIATVPATMTVPSGTTTGTFLVTSKVVPLDSGVTISESYHGLPRTADLLVTAQKIASLTLTPNPVVGGNTVQGKVTLAGPAVGSTVIQLVSTAPTVASVPASVTISSGQLSANFSVTTHMVGATTFADIFATLGGSQQQATLTVTALQLTGFVITPSTVFEKQTVTGVVTLNGAALSGGAIVTISNSNPAAAAVPTSVTIPQGQTSKTFTFPANAVTTNQFATITATKGSVAIPQQLSVTPISLQSIQVSQNTVTGGVNVSGVVRIVAPAPSGGFIVQLSSSYPGVVKVPVSVTIPAGATSATFTATTYAVPQTYFVTLTGTHNSSFVTTQIQVLPPEVATFRLSTTSVTGGTNITGTVTLTGKAPTGGMHVTITANPNLAQAVSTVTVPAGSTSYSFPISTSTVPSPVVVNISAMTLSVIKSASVTLHP